MNLLCAVFLRTLSAPKDVPALHSHCMVLPAVLRDAPSFPDARLVQFLRPVFESNGRQNAVVRGLALRVVEHLGVLEDALPCGFADQVGASSDAFPLEEPEDAFRNGIEALMFVAVASSAHSGFQVVQAK